MKFVAKLSDKILIGQELLAGNVNLRSQRKMDLKEIKTLLEAVLYSKGLDFIESEDCLEVLQGSGSIVKVYDLQYLKAADLAKSLTQMFRMSFRVGNNRQNIQISAVDGANALMVLAPKNQHLDIARTIKELDMKVRQLLLDIMVIEVTKTETFGFGVTGEFHDTPSATPTVGGTTTGLVNGAVNTPMHFGGTDTASAIGYSYSHGNWNFRVDAVDNSTKLKILSQPRVIATENKKSEVKIGKKTTLYKWRNKSTVFRGRYSININNNVKRRCRD